MVTIDCSSVAAMKRGFAEAEAKRQEPNPVHAAALSAIEHGLSPIPTKDKAPALYWKDFQKRKMTPAEIGRYFKGWPHGIGIVCGAVSGHLEVLDFDLAGTAFESFWLLLEGDAPVSGLAPGLLDRLPIEKTPSEGFHLFYRVPGPVPKSRVLAERLVEGKAKVLIETRGEGG